MNPNKKIRRLQSLLYTSGVGTILFSLWSGIKGAGVLYGTFKSGFTDGNKIITDKRMIAAIVIFFILIFGGSILMYIYIGRKAILTALGEKTSNKYIVLSILILVLSVITYGRSLLGFTVSDWFKLDNLVITAINLTSDVILAETIVFSIMLKKLR